MAKKKKAGSGRGKPRKKAAQRKQKKKAAPRKKASGKKTAGKKKAAGKKTAGKKASGKKAAGKKASGKKAAGKKTAGKKAAGKKPAGSSTSRAPARRPSSRGKASTRGAAFFDHFRQRLLDQRQEITRRLDELREELAGLEQAPPRELEEWAQEEKDRDILIRLEERETDELRRIQAALGLIDSGEYGRCQNCGKPIPRARLEELPTAFRCIDCTP